MGLLIEGEGELMNDVHKLGKCASLYLRMRSLYPGASSSLTGWRNRLAYLHTHKLNDKRHTMGAQGRWGWGGGLTCVVPHASILA